jgi:hypothetical protein
VAISAIHDWLAARGTYSLGVQLLNLHGDPSPAQRFIFSLPESPVTRQRLVEALTTLNQAATVARTKHDAKAIADVAEVTPADHRAFQRTLSADPPTDLPPEALPLELRQLRRDLTKAHKELTFLRGLMVKTPDGSELRAIADKVIGLDDFNIRGWRQIEYWRETGNLYHEPDQPPKPTAEELDKANAMKRRQAIRTWLSQRKSTAKNPRPFTPEQMAAKTAELEQLDRLLNGPPES